LRFGAERIGRTVCAAEHIEEHIFAKGTNFLLAHLEVIFVGDFNGGEYFLGGFDAHIGGVEEGLDLVDGTLIEFFPLENTFKG
jgi:hypothetical protein